MVDCTTMRNPPTPRRSTVLLAPLLLAPLLLIGCGPEEVSDIDQQALEDVLLSYLPVMSEGYASGNLEPLRGHTVEKELARMFKRISDLAVEGKFVEPELKTLTVEDIYMWGNGANAVVTTFEVWDLRVYASPSRQLLAQEMDQPNRVQYTLKRSGGRWRIYNRELVSTIQQP